ncbi:30S ribosomal protein S11 [Candidatus Roizmanbacteria bacterium RIFCSPHIGHO2_02_FULL_37_13b]|uniref:Small ribosomal subunit protein uS11 n=1 Tax=Candidatus Roizmanbacteria bacterium RIFCSPLOWO2_02_FULL_36_11 TaxID=1802071 RepID=A0A1F7JCH2_9BACT|nr:MAG: 30S ribosomal protein S11 [Candidatus Roizmanbacteria bacterium RIFCSPHIGHO2_02_FULL_37_13b]OGK53310.1 MAG: 30S ribosomal protein S11 [Candidatus Roizmanbacteria bacterium RIFCSPLOWO2_02_FULL_36_11]
MQSKKKTKKIVEKGRIYITATFNNTLITLTDERGAPFLFGGCGMYGFAGTRKSTPYAATVTVKATVKKGIDESALREVDIYIKGIGPGREASLKAIRSMGLDVDKIIDITPIPHNGVRPPKIRRG